LPLALPLALPRGVGRPFARLLGPLAAARALLTLRPESLRHVATDVVLDLVRVRVRVRVTVTVRVRVRVRVSYGCHS